MTDTLKNLTNDIRKAKPTVDIPRIIQ